MLQDVQHKLREAFKKSGDEFLTSQMALHGKVGKSWPVCLFEIAYFLYTSAVQT